MAQQIFSNNDEVNTDDTTQTPAAAEHETHWPALILMVVLTVGVVAVTITYSTPDASQPTADTPVTQTPTDRVPTAQAAGTDGLPDTFTLPATTTIEQNYQAPFGTDKTQRVIVFTTPDTTDSLISHFRTQSENAGMNITKATTSASSGVVIAEVPDQSRMIAVIAPDTDSSRRVQVNFVYR